MLQLQALKSGAFNQGFFAFQLAAWLVVAVPARIGPNRRNRGAAWRARWTGGEASGESLSSIHVLSYRQGAVPSKDVLLALLPTLSPGPVCPVLDNRVARVNSAWDIIGGGDARATVARYSIVVAGGCVVVAGGCGALVLVLSVVALNRLPT